MIFFNIFIYFSLLKVEISIYFNVKQIHNEFINKLHKYKVLCKRNNSMLKFKKRVLLMNVLNCLLRNLFMASGDILNKFINCLNNVMLQPSGP